MLTTINYISALTAIGFFWVGFYLEIQQHKYGKRYMRIGTVLIILYALTYKYN